MTVSRNPKTFVLVHGAWHGGWCWQRVATILQARGHTVTTPTQTGLGERSHLLSTAVTLSTFVQDIVNHLTWENMTNVVLVGHSFGGPVITGVADAVRERVSTIIYLDTAILKNGASFFDLYPPNVVAERNQAAEAFSNGLSLPVPTVDELRALGLSAPADLAFVNGRLTPHPLATFKTPLMLTHPLGAELPVSYIMCTDPVYEVSRSFHRQARNAGWHLSEIATGHEALTTEPVATDDALERLAQTTV